MRLAILAAFALAGAVVPAAAEELSSGPALGSLVDEFPVIDCTGPAKGRTLCYRCRYLGRPTAAIFARTLTPELATLAAGLDAATAAHRREKLAAFVVYLHADPFAARRELEKLAEEQRLARTPLTVYREPAGPASYQLAAEAEVTVLMWDADGLLRVRRAFAPGELTASEASAVLKETAAILAAER